MPGFELWSDEERKEVVRLTAGPHHRLQGREEHERTIAIRDVPGHVVDGVQEVTRDPQCDRHGGDRDE